MEIEGELLDCLLLLRGAAIRIDNFGGDVIRYRYIDSEDIEYLDTLVTHVNARLKELKEEIDKRSTNGD